MTGSESGMLWHLQRRHRLPVDRHHRCEAWKLCPQGWLEISHKVWHTLIWQGRTQKANLTLWSTRCALFLGIWMHVGQSRVVLFVVASCRSVWIPATMCQSLTTATMWCAARSVTPGTTPTFPAATYLRKWNLGQRWPVLEYDASDLLLYWCLFSQFSFFRYWNGVNIVCGHLSDEECCITRGNGLKIVRLLYPVSSFTLKSN